MSVDPQAFLQPPAVPHEHVQPEIVLSEGMADWLVAQQLSLAFTSYQSGRLIVAGVDPDRRLSFNEQYYARAMGLCYSRGTLHIASLFQIWSLQNLLREGEFANRAFDCLLVPRKAHVTGYIDAHELGIDQFGRPILVNTLYSCLATTDDEFNFRPLWKPRFISDLAPEDRCHLNGLAMDEGTPRYVTALDKTDEASGWRGGAETGGVVIDVGSGEIIGHNLHMPHSPRVHDGQLWLLESGRGYLVRLDPRTGLKEDIAFCPGYGRGLAFHGHHAVIGLSRPRQGSRRLPLDDELERRGVEPWCALVVVDLRRGEIVEFIRYDTEVTELFDIALLPGVRNPATIGPATMEILTTRRFDASFASPPEAWRSF